MNDSDSHRQRSIYLYCLLVSVCCSLLITRKWWLDLALARAKGTMPWRTQELRSFEESCWRCLRVAVRSFPHGWHVQELCSRSLPVCSLESLWARSTGVGLDPPSSFSSINGTRSLWSSAASGEVDRGLAGSVRFTPQRCTSVLLGLGPIGS